MFRKCIFLIVTFVIIFSLSACGTSPEKTAPVPTPTPTPAPAPKETPSPKPPITPKTATFSVETKNLIIHYPNFVDEEIAKEQAKILQQAYDFYYDLIGQEYPYNGEIINIIFDSSRGNTSSSGNPIIMGLDSGIFDGRILPPEPAFFHELVHNFTIKDRTNVAKYVDINGAITEAFADLFTNYFRYEELKYSRGSITHWFNTLKEYESKETDPYSLDWGPHKDAQPFIGSIFYYISEKYGWEVWNRFFLVARNSNVEGIPLHKQGSFIDLRRSEDAIAFGNFVYILSVVSGENLIPTFENWGFQFEKQTKEKTSQMYKVHSVYLAGLANQYYEEALNKRDTEKYAEAINKLSLSTRIYENLGHMQEVERIEILLEEIRSNNIIIDGVIDEWPSTAAMISDPSGDVSSDATSEKGADLKAIYTHMDENYLYVAIQVYRGLEPSLRRNYFIALDFNSDQRDEYHFGVRPDGNNWVFDHTIDENNWNAESTLGVVAAGEGDTIEVRIPRKEYEIPESILIYCRVTDGESTMDSTKWFEVPGPAQLLLEYTVTIEHPETHLAHVSLTMSNIHGSKIDLRIRPIAETTVDHDKPFIKEVTITSKQGRIVSGPSFERGQWLLVVDTEEGNSVTIDYTVEQLLRDPHGAYESYIGEDFAVIVPNTLLLYPKSSEVKGTIHFIGPDGWNVSSIWEEVETDLFSFKGAEELDNFVAFGPFNSRTKEIGELEVMLSVFEGVESQVDPDESFQVIEDLTDYYSQAFKPLNKEELHWIVVSDPVTGGGVREGSFLVSAVRMENFWGIFAHEYVHLWNGKGVGVDPVWFREGATELLTYRGLVDNGTISEGARNEILLRDWQIYLGLIASGEDKAVSTAVRPDPNINYRKGHLVNYALDLTIQDITKGERDFLDVTRYLSANYWDDRISNDDLLQAVNHVTGADFSDFFSKYVYGTEKLPLQFVEGMLVLE